jgi:hypothetical protein
VKIWYKNRYLNKNIVEMLRFQEKVHSRKGTNFKPLEIYHSQAEKAKKHSVGEKSNLIYYYVHIYRE